MDEPAESGTTVWWPPYPNGVIRKGTVAGQHWEWTAWVEGKPFMLFHLYYRMGEDMTPAWHLGPSRHRIVLQGNPNLEMTLEASPDAEGRQAPSSLC